MGRKNRKVKKGGLAGHSGPKVSITKLSNKRLSKLAKQGKLKKRMPKSELLKFMQGRTTGEPELEVTDPSEDQAKPEAEDIPLVEADYDYFSTENRNFDFLMKVSEDEKKKKRKRKRNTEESEEAYEKVPRKGQVDTSRPLLPIKDKDKGIVARSEVIEEEEEEVEQVEEAAEVKAAEPLPALTTVELLRQRQKKLGDLKAKIAVLSCSVSEFPEENTRKLKELRLMLEEDDPDICVTVKKLVMVSLCEVFKDIIPDYRIREVTDTEKQQSAKKETKQLRDFEASLITNYKHYLEFLESVAKGKKPKVRSKEKRKRPMGVEIPAEAAGDLSFIGVKCLCELLVRHPHFNYRTNIISVIVPFAAHNNAKVSDLVCGFLKKLFREDRHGQVTLEVVRLIGRIIKTRKFQVHPKVLQVFLALRIKEVLKPEDKEKEKQEKEKQKKDDRNKMSRRDKKRKKQLKELEQELEEAAVSTDHRKRLRIHTEIISMVFLTYFRILKQAQDSVLLSPVLEGLAKFAHLINIDFFDDLFSVLNELVDSGDLEYRESLHCVQTAFTLLSGAGLALNVDPRRFYNHLYRVLYRLHSGASSEEVPIALRCLDILITKRRKQVSHQRILAFIKRLSTVSLQLSSGGAMGVLATIRSFLHADPAADILFDTDHQGSGLFLPQLDEPEHCNAHNTALYELNLMNRHYHPSVVRYSEHVTAGAPSTGHGQLAADMARRSGEELYIDYDTSEMTFNPPPDSKPTASKKYGRFSRGFIQSDLLSQVAPTEAEINEQLKLADIAALDFETLKASKPQQPNLNLNLDSENEDNENKMEDPEPTDLTDTEKVLLSLTVQEEKEEEASKEELPPPSFDDRYKNKRGPGFKRPGFRNKHFSRKRGSGGKWRGGGGGRGRGGRGRR